MTWQEIKVEDIASREPNALATGPFGSSISAKFFAPTGVPVIRGGNLSQDVGVRLIDEGLVFVSPEKAKEFCRSVVRAGDLVFTCWGTIDQVGLIDSRARFSEYVISNKQMKLTPDAKIADSLFLYYLFKSKETRAAIRNAGIGSSVPGFNLGQLRSMRLRVPPLNTQRAIASLLGSLDDKIELNRRTNETLETIARSLFRKRLEPDRCTRMTVDTLVARGILAVGDGYRAKNTELGPSGLPFVRVGDVRDGLVFDTEDHLTDSSVAVGQGKVAQPGDVLFTSKGTLGRFVLVRSTTRKFVYSPQMCFWRSRDAAQLAPLYLYYWMQSRRFLDQVDRVRGQNDMVDYVSLREQKLMYVDVPDRDDQAWLETVLEPIEERIDAARRESITLAEFRDALLPRLLSGELRIRHAEKLAEATL